MRYKTLFLQKMDNIDSTVQQIDRAVSMGEGKRALEFIEKIKDQLEEIRSALNIEPDDYAQQFK